LCSDTDFFTVLFMRLRKTHLGFIAFTPIHNAVFLKGIMKTSPTLFEIVLLHSLTIVIIISQQNLVKITP